MASPHTSSVSRGAQSIDEVFTRAQSFHENNRLTEAEELYRAGLHLDPKHLGCRYYLGVVTGQLGRLNEAESLIRSALAQNPNLADAHNSLGNVLAALNRSDEAIAEFRTAIALEPDHVEALNNLGITLLEAREFRGAIDCFEQALAIDSDVPEAHVNLGNALVALNRPEEAIPCYRKALTLRPDFAVAHNNLGLALVALKRPHEAIAEYERAIALNPDYADAHYHLAKVLVAQNRLEEAIARFQQSLEIRADSATAHNDFGAALTALDRPAEALAHYERACQLQPDFAEAHSNLGVAFAALERYEDSLVSYQKALAIRPGLPEVHINLGYALIALHRPEEAIASFEQALSGDSNRAEAYHGLGIAWQSLGRTAESRQSLTRAIQLAPHRPDYYCHLSRVKRFDVGDPHLVAMEDLARNLQSFSERQQVELHFALSKALADLDQHDRAFRHLLTGNALKRRRLGYDETAILGAFQRMRAVVTRDLIHRMRGRGDPSDVPIFIVGMPRSGTTLVEQVLASHSDVFGAGELNEIGQAVNALDQSGRGDVPFPEIIPFLSVDQLRQIGARYIAEASAGAAPAARITDKMPGNFCFVGFIHLIVPNARIIHVRRDPRDTCFSCFAQLFAKGLEWSYDLGEVGRYYQAYEALMEHWRRALPAGVMLEVQYEEFVTDFEPQARRLIDFCGLEWDDRCFAFHKTQRPIWTASATQVREPIYRSSIGRWKPYERMLQPLFDELSRSD
jgi:tetratricopeptide (TPR) repeat protein